MTAPASTGVSVGVVADVVVDVVVVGCGGVGSAVAAELARRGRRVIAFDRFAPRHIRGSSHGTERIVRAAYTDRVYSELVVHSLEGWRALEAETGEQLLNICGGFDTGYLEELDRIETNLSAVGVPCEMLDVREATSRFPGFRFEWPVLWQPTAGTVNADAAVGAFQRVAVEAGADLRFETTVDRIDHDTDGVRVRAGDLEVSAAVCVVTVGAWAEKLAGFAMSLPPLKVTDEQVFFYRPLFDMRWPTFITRTVPEMYGLPTPGGLVKAGGHYEGPVCDPDDRRPVDGSAAEAVSNWIAANVPWLDPVPVSSTTCLYASYPDEDFVIDRVGPLVLGLGLGGHGFKFLPELGWRLAELCEGRPWVDNPFAIERAPRHVGPSGHK